MDLLLGIYEYFEVSCIVNWDDESYYKKWIYFVSTEKFIFNGK